MFSPEQYSQYMQAYGSAAAPPATTASQPYGGSAGYGQYPYGAAAAAGQQMMPPAGSGWAQPPATAPAAGAEAGPPPPGAAPAGFGQYAHYMQPQAGMAPPAAAVDGMAPASSSYGASHSSSGYGGGCGGGGASAAPGELPPGASHSGVVKSFDEEKGYGFIECKETGTDVFVNRSELNGALVRAGDEVAFTVAQGNKGLRAEGVRVLGKSTELTALPAYMGSIKFFDNEKGYGFIKNDDLKHRSGKDLLLLRSELNGASVQAGDEVSFSIQEDRKGPKAVNVQVLRRGPSASDLPRYNGTIKSFDYEKGFGFIQSVEVKDMSGKDLLLLKSELKGSVVRAGDQVLFSIGSDSKGMKALNIEITARAPDYAEQAIAAAAAQNGHDTSAEMLMMLRNMAAIESHRQAQEAAGASAGFPAATAATPQCPAQEQQLALPGPAGPPQPSPQSQPPADLSGQTLVGTVKNFLEEKGFGFIHCDETNRIHQKDVFFMKSLLRGQACASGDQVQFSYRMGPKGPSASDVVVLTHAAPQGGAAYQPSFMAVPGAVDLRSCPY